MRNFRQPVMILAIVCIAIAIMSTFSTKSTGDDSMITVPEWSTAWIRQSEMPSLDPPANVEWHSATAESPLTEMPNEAAGSWVYIIVPPTSPYHHPGLLIEKLYGLDVTVYEGNDEIYRSSRGYDFERNIVLVPLTVKPTASNVYIRIESKEGAGIGSPVRIGEYADLSSLNVRRMLPNVLLGAAIAFLGLIMLVSTGFFVRKLTKAANALGLFILSTGMLIVTNSSLPYYYFPDYGPMLFFLFDMFMLVLCPSLLYFIVRSFDEPYAWLMKVEKWLIGYFGASFIVMIVYKSVGGTFYFYYKLFTFWILAPLVLAQLIVTIVLAVRNAYRGYSNSMLPSIGIIALAVSGIAELVILFIRHGMYEFVLWKFGLVFLIACLVMALNRRIAADYAKLLTYSKELELFNHQLEKTERMRILSEMAASIAHEIRNPLQVTRGFLQLLSGKANEENRNQFGMAISELDRAAAIITDYLTFAKPEQEVMVSMDVKQQLDTIATIIHPMVMLNGGVLQVDAADPLTIVGSPSKFKQALINILKNSAESLQDENGKIEVKAYEDNATVVIRISDNGQGMDEEQLAKLGNPYFSTKTKGTGLGLMVTFRIIEVMQGTLEFRSEKGKGTEATIRFPIASQA